MKLTDEPAEIVFEKRIDGCFPYEDRERCTALINEAQGISLNASFCVLDEISRPPMLGMVTTERQRELVAEWASGLEHELKEPLLVCAAALIEEKPLPWAFSITLMEQIGNFAGQRAALGVAYFAGDCDSVEGDAALSAAERRIREVWDKRAV